MASGSHRAILTFDFPIIVSAGNERQLREREVFLEVCDIGDTDTRRSRLDELCGDDALLRDRVESLLTLKESENLFEPRSEVRNVFEGLLEVKSPHSANRQNWQPPQPKDLDQLLEAYKVEALIGRGGMGAVYRGTQLSLGRPVAIKILPPEFAEDPAFAGRFHREALAMAKLEHPNLVTIHHFGFAEPYYFIVMDFVDGNDLQHLISNGILQPEAAPGIVGQICDALQYAHDHGYVHRDIKPANIFLTGDGQVKVGDFGLAKLASTEDTAVTQLTMSGYRIGTPNYMAPETLNYGAVDHRADIYSLGVMFYEMLTGNVPKGVFDPPSRKVQVDVRVDEVVLKAMREEPGNRYQQASEVKTAVEAITSTKSQAKGSSRVAIPNWVKPLAWAVVGVLLGVTGTLMTPTFEKIGIRDLGPVSLEERVNADGEDIGDFASMTLVDGCPAISFYNQTHKSVYFVIADDPAATGWGRPAEVDPHSSAGRFSSLEVIDGRPAISYRYDGNRLHFAIADDASGTRWRIQRSIDNDSVVRSTSLALVNGVPAIAFIDVHEKSSPKLKYAYASTATGLGAWTVVTIDDIEAPNRRDSNSISLTVVDGRPAICYKKMPWGLYYVRAADPLGSSWQPSVRASGAGYQPSMKVIAGHPAIGFKQDNYVYYVRAKDSTGVEWGQPMKAGGDRGDYISLNVASGRPTLFYRNQNTDDSTGLSFVVSTDETGASWEAPVEIESVPKEDATFRCVNFIELAEGGAVSYIYDTQDSSGNDLKFTILPDLPAATADAGAKK